METTASTSHPFIAKKHDVTIEVQLLFEATKTLDRGSLITHSDISAITKKDRGPVYNIIIKKWRSKVEELRGIVVTAASPLGTGYRLCTSEEQLVHYAEKKRASSMRQIAMAQKALAIIPNSDLSETQNDLRHAKLSQFAERQKIDKEQRAIDATWKANSNLLPKFNPENRPKLSGS